MTQTIAGRRGLQATGATPAGGVRRLMAYLTDLVVWLGLATGVYLLSDSWVLALIVAVELGLIVVFLQAGTGRALGGQLFRAYAVKAGTNRAPGLGLQSLHTLLMAVMHLTVVGPLITCLATKNGQNWIDRMIGTGCATTPQKTSSRASRAMERELVNESLRSRLEPQRAAPSPMPVPPVPMPMPVGSMPVASMPLPPAPLPPGPTPAAPGPMSVPYTPMSTPPAPVPMAPVPMPVPPASAQTAPAARPLPPAPAPVAPAPIPPSSTPTPVLPGPTTWAPPPQPIAYPGRAPEPQVIQSTTYGHEPK